MTLGYVALGLFSGVLSGLIGVGGGVVIVPALVFIFGLSQHQAQGTTLALLVPPIGILAAWEYYKQGYVDLRVAALVCLGFLFGGLLGGKLAVTVSERALRRIFGGCIFLISLKMMAGK
jgi:uncharacterized protein